MHYERGLECIDCHSSAELHGDGNIYVRKEYEVAVRCESCHGTPDEPATLKDSQDRKLTTLYRSGQDVVQTGKVSGRRFIVRQLDQLAERNALPVAMRIPAHMQDLPDRNKLDCAACHAKTAQQCYGCHLKKDDRQMSPADWVEGTGEGYQPRPSPGKWEGELTYSRWEDPALGVNSRNRVAPFVPGSQVFFTKIGLDGKVRPVNTVTDTISGASRLSMNPVQPHSTTRAARSCESCHSDPKALGLGSGYVVTRDQGWAIDFPLDRMVDEEGRQLQDVSHPEGRPFTVKEMNRISSLNSCLGCHKEMDNKDFWQSVVGASGTAKTAKDHQDILGRIFRMGALNVKPLLTPPATPLSTQSGAPRTATPAPPRPTLSVIPTPAR